MTNKPGCVTGCLKGASCGCVVTLVPLIILAALFADSNADFEGFGVVFLVLVGAIIGGFVGVINYFDRSES